MQLPQLPICCILPELKKILAQGLAVLSAPPGSGKTTIVPRALCLDVCQVKDDLRLLVMSAILDTASLVAEATRTTKRKMNAAKL